MESFKYEGKTPVKSRASIEIYLERDDEWVWAKVVDTLSTQFTCVFENRTYFRFYKDEGLTWRQTK